MAAGNKRSLDKLGMTEHLPSFRPLPVIPTGAQRSGETSRRPWLVSGEMAAGDKRSLDKLGMTDGALGMTDGALGMTDGALGMTDGALGMTSLG